MKRKLLTTLLLVIAISLQAQDFYRNWTVVNSKKKERIALIMANNTYETGGALTSPIPMALKLEEKLKSEGFDVLVGRDMNRMRMISILDDFSNRFRDYEFGMIFYLGHGFQVDGRNYLIPVDANPKSKSDLEYHAIQVDYVLGRINDPKTPKVIVLDACRDNPFLQSWGDDDQSGSNSGFGNVNAPRNAEIFFTTGEGTRVRDDNPYLEYFMEELNQGACLADIKRVVSKRIFEFNNDQVPASYGQLFDEVCFGDPPKPKPDVVKKDSDGDGILDQDDDCPYVSGVAEYNGCPPPKVKAETAEDWWKKGDELYQKAFKSSDRYELLGEAFSWIEKAAKADHYQAMRRLGYMYRYDQGVPIGIELEDRYKNAIYWYTKAAERGSISCMRYLGEIYTQTDGEEILTADFDLSYFWYKKASDAGDVKSKIEIGRLYEYGWIDRTDYQKKYRHRGEMNREKAREIYQEGYEEGEVLGKLYLARSYDRAWFDPESIYNGIDGDPRGEKSDYDLAMAIEIYEELANEANLASMLRLYQLYIASKSTWEKGLYWLRKAVDKGDGSAMYQLGIAYKYGKYGLKRDKKRGQELIDKACASGYRFAC